MAHDYSMIPDSTLTLAISWIKSQLINHEKKIIIHAFL